MPADPLLARRLGDRLLLHIVDASFAEAAQRAGTWCACRVGCTECCRGPFPINALDAWRLGEGMHALDETDRRRAEEVRRRAAAAVALTAAVFPGNRHTGELGEDDRVEEAFCEEFRGVPCPALDPATGACDLYEWRPISCRTYGPPVRFGAQDVPPCRFWFVGAAPEVVEQARVEPDPEDRERDILKMVEADGETGDTIVAYALVRSASQALAGR